MFGWGKTNTAERKELEKVSKQKTRRKHWSNLYYIEIDDNCQDVQI